MLPEQRPAAGVDRDSADDAQLLASAGAADRGEKPALQAVALEVQLQPGQDPAAAIEDALWVAAAVQWGGVVREVLPEKCAARLDEPRLLKIGAALAKVARHYQWKFGGLIAHPLAGLALECFPVAEPVVLPMLVDLVKKKPAAAAPPAGAAAAGSSSQAAGAQDLAAVH